ncbi:MAG: phenylalanine--tRNA ligase subunit beta [Terrimicrobiaceae bacterium]
MKVSLNWLRDFVDCQLSAGELEVLFRRAGLEVASVESLGADFDKVVVAKILESNPHPNADRLSVCRVDDGSGTPRQIVCGAKNYKVGDKVPLALPGAVLPGDFKIKTGKLRGVESEGMMCSAKELKLAGDSEGLLILPQDAVIGSPVGDVFPPDTLFELEITPNRPDWLCHLGVAREIAMFTGLPLSAPGIPAPAFARANQAVQLETEECSYYTLRRIRGVKVGPSPRWLADRLASIGLRPVNNVVDVTNYVLFELGQPLHAFDAAKIEGALHVRRATEGEVFRALDGRDHKLSGEYLVITDDKRPVALAGVMGGEDSGVSATTTDILLESAVFEPAFVRRASRALGLISDSSYRFERGVDPEMVASASARAAELIVQVAGGVAEDVVLEAGGHWARTEISLRHARVRSLLGFEISDEEIEDCLSKVGLEKTSGGGDSSWSVPGFRHELTREADLIEEISRFIGIERIPSHTSGPFASSSIPDAAYDFLMARRQALAGLGFHEARTSTLVSIADAAWFGPAVELKNPFGDDQSRLRTSLLPGLLTALKRNLDLGSAAVRLFECGRIFTTSGESPRIALVASGDLTAADWRGTARRKWDIFDLKGAVAEFVGLSDDDFAPLPNPPLPFGSAIEIFKNGIRIGLLGVLHPAEARKLDASAPVVAAEFDAAAWQGAVNPIRAAKPLPKFPGSTRDIALTAPLQLAYGDVRAAVLAQKEPLLESVSLFDLFTDPTGKKLSPDHKSLAISLTFRSAEKTLTTEEVNASTDRLKAGLKERLGVDFRE